MRISDWSSDVCSSDLRTRMSGLRIYADTHDGYGNQAKDDMLTFGAMLSVGGQIDSIEKFVADETVYTFNPTTGRATGDYSRSEEHTSELQSLIRTWYAVFCWKKKKKRIRNNTRKSK